MALDGSQLTAISGTGGGVSFYRGVITAKVETEIVIVTGGARKRRIYQFPDLKRPWEQPDEIDKAIIEDVKKQRKKRKLLKPQPDFDSQLELERIDRELIAELKKHEEHRKKQARRRKAIEMLLLS